MGEHNERREAASIDERGVCARRRRTRSATPWRRALLALEGELDLAAAPALRKRVDEFAGESLVLDFARVTFIDSAVLKELLRARAELADDGTSSSCWRASRRRCGGCSTSRGRPSCSRTRRTSTARSSG